MPDLHYGMWIWNLKKCEGGDPVRLLARAQTVGLDHVILKIADGTKLFNGNPLRPLVRRLQEGGLQVWVWTYTYGHDAEREAHIFTERALSLQANGLVVDLEGDAYSRTDGQDRARRFFATLRGLAPVAHVGLSSHRFPAAHPKVPIGYSMGWCNSWWPQAYYLHQGPGVDAQMDRVMREGRVWGQPVFVTGASYPEGTGAVANIGRFVAACRRHHVPRVNWWSWEHATEAMWDAIRTAIRVPEEV